MDFILRFAIVGSLAALIAGCDSLVDDRLTKLTGAKSEVERVYMCGEVYQEEAVKARVLRDSVVSDMSKATALAMIEEADSKSGKFIVMLDKYSSEDHKQASSHFNKTFTRKEFTELFGEYGSVLKAHCNEML